jgi:aldose 1-epimerase
MASVELEAGGDRCVVDLEAGGRLASLRIRGVERLLTREAAEGAAIPEAVAWGSFLMAPWVGRLEDGRLPWQGRIHQLPSDFGPHAIHGTVKDRPWVVEQQDASVLMLSCPLDEPWPFGGQVRQEVALTPGNLELAAEVVAEDREMPAGIGWHPWFARPLSGDVRVRLAATGTLVTRDDRIPTGQVAPLEPDTDLRDGPLLGERRLDHVYVGVGNPALLIWPDLELRIAWEPPVDSVCVHSPPRGVCVEPQTAWPNAPALAAGGVVSTGLAVARPGTPLRARTMWSWR